MLRQRADAGDADEVFQLIAKTRDSELTEAAYDELVSRCTALYEAQSVDPSGKVRRNIDVAGNGRFVRTVIEAATRKAKARMAADPTVDLLTADESKIKTITRNDIDGAITDVLAALNIVSP